MAITKTAKVEAEIAKIKAKMAEQQARLKELELKKTELENTEIVDIVRGMSVPLEELAAFLQAMKGGKGSPAATSGQIVPNPAPEYDEEEEDTYE
jgi:hypothetical protein